MNLLQAAQWGEQQLAANGIESSRFEADLLLAEVTKLKREELYLERERNLTKIEIPEYKSLIGRRLKREPLQYILQRQEFMGLDFYVDKRVLIPRADSEVLVEKFLELNDGPVQKFQLQNKRLKIIDACTGSGALAISIAHFHPNAEVTGTDLSVQALEVAKLNAERLGVKVEWLEGDFLKPAQGEQWDWIITNPPYVSLKDYQECAPEVHYEPLMALVGGKDGLDFYHRLSTEGQAILADHGKILMEIGWDQAQAVEELFQAKGFRTEVFQDLAGRDRVVLAR